MPALPGCDKPIRSSTEMTLWWAAVLPPDRTDPSMSMMWLDPTGRMCGRVLCITGVPLMPTGTVLRTLLDVHDTVVTQEPAAEGHLALALCRPGDAEISEADDEWTEALHDYLDDQLGGTWSLHLAAGDRLTPLAQPLTWTFRRGLHLDLFQAAVDLGRLS